MRFVNFGLRETMSVTQTKKRPFIGLGDFVEVRRDARMIKNGPPYGVVTAIQPGSDPSFDMVQVENHWRYFTQDEVALIEREMPTAATVSFLLREIAASKTHIEQIERMMAHLLHVMEKCAQKSTAAPINNNE